MNKLKVGDKVKGISADIKGCEGIIVKDTGDGFDIMITKLGKIQKELGWNYDGEFKVGKVLKRNTYWENCLKLIPQTSKSPRQFVLLKDTLVNFGVDIIKSGTVFTFFERDNDYRDDHHWFNKESVESQPEWFKEIFEDKCNECKHNDDSVFCSINCRNNNKFSKESKEIKPFKHLFLSINLGGTTKFQQTDEFKEWVKQITDAVNSFNNEK